VAAWVYRASAVGRSLRCLATARQGYDPLPPPDYLELAAEAGNRYEIIVKAKLRAEGYRISGEQNELESEVKPGVIVRGHVDAIHCLAPNDDTDRILEVKSMSQRVWDKWLGWGFKGFPEYAAQISVYMHAESERRGKPIEATYAVINRETDEMEVRTVSTPPTPIPSIFQKVALAEQFADMHKLPTCDSASQYMCPYNYICDKNEILFEEIEQGSEAMLRQLATEHEEIKKTIEALEDNKEGVRAQIRTALAGRKGLKIIGWSFSNKPRKARKLNMVRLRERLGDELDDYFDETESDPVLMVSPTKGK
jgi:hypothetical protein